MDRVMHLLNAIWPGPPGEQATAGGLLVAKSALFVAVSGFMSPSFLGHCPGGPYFREDVEQWYYQLASYATAMLGVGLLLGEMAFSTTVVRPQVIEAAAPWLVYLTKLSTVGTLQFWLHVFHFCLKMLYTRLRGAALA